MRKRRLSTSEVVALALGGAIPPRRQVVESRYIDSINFSVIRLFKRHLEDIIREGNSTLHTAIGRISLGTRMRAT
jgi:hypothetical protein